MTKRRISSSSSSLDFYDESDHNSDNDDDEDDEEEYNVSINDSITTTTTPTTSSSSSNNNKANGGGGGGTDTALILPLRKPSILDFEDEQGIARALEEFDSEYDEKDKDDEGYDDRQSSKCKLKSIIHRQGGQRHHSTSMKMNKKNTKTTRAENPPHYLAVLPYVLSSKEDTGSSFASSLTSSSSISANMTRVERFIDEAIEMFSSKSKNIHNLPR